MDGTVAQWSVLLKFYEMYPNCEVFSQINNLISFMIIYCLYNKINEMMQMTP